jgi:uncharacterized protein
VIHSPFIFSLGDLDPGRGRQVHVDAPADWSVDASHLSGGVVADLRLDAHAGGVMVTGAATATFSHTCNRCLEAFSAAVTAKIAQDFVSEDGSEYQVRDDEIDTEPLLRDELLLSLPLTPLCRPDCRGLCPECGTDLNTGACSGHEVEKASPFAELRSLFDQE